MNLSALLKAGVSTIKASLNNVEPIRLRADLNVLIADWQHLDSLAQPPEDKVKRLLKRAEPLLMMWQKTEPEQSRALFLGLHYWLVQNNCEIPHAAYFINELSLFANQCHDPELLKQLCDMLPIFIEALPLHIKKDEDIYNPNRPWRVIHLNYAIIATRTHDPKRMTKAFQALVSQLPHEAQSFFDEGMRQMQKINYPAHVQAVMTQYHTLWQSKGKQN